jgi:hypothetical protein
MDECRLHENFKNIHRKIKEGVVDHGEERRINYKCNLGFRRA